MNIFFNFSNMLQKYRLMAIGPFAWLFISLPTLSYAQQDHNKMKAKPPIAKKIDHKMTQHKHERNDPYYWMRDDKKESPDVIHYLEAWNTYTEQELIPVASLRQKLFDELVGRVEKKSHSVPFLLGNNYYQSLYSDTQEYPVHVRFHKDKPRIEEIVLDENELAKGQQYLSVGHLLPSPNEKLIAFAQDTVGRRIYEIRILNLDTGAYLKDTIQNAGTSLAWSKDSQSIFYIKKDPQTLLDYQIYRHKLGTSPQSDQLVYEETDSSYYTYFASSRDNNDILIFHDSTTKQYVSRIDASNPSEPPKALFKPSDAMEYSVEKLGNWYYALTNWQAKNFRIMRFTLQTAHDPSQWDEVVPHRPDIYISSMEAFTNHLVLLESHQGQEKLRIVHINDKTKKDLFIPFDEPAYNITFSNNTAENTDTVRIVYSSLTTPATHYDINLNTLEKKLLKQRKVLGDFATENYQSERLMVTAKDGQLIPVSLVYRKDRFTKNASAPLMVYGYGSYGTTVSPSFNSSILSLVDRGFVYAIAHVRGGSFLGRPWYEAGKLLSKKNSFTDFIDVTKSLIDQKYADPDKVFAQGGSAGGLLMGAVINMEPELYHGVTANVPFVDVVTTMSDPSIPLTTNEYDEWGNPANKEHYDYMLSYSPYDQVSKQNYPNLLVTAGFHDSQVQYFEPMKWVAKLQELKTDKNKLLFHTNMEAGHSGLTGRFQRYKNTALEYAFYLMLLGHTDNSDINSTQPNEPPSRSEAPHDKL